MNAGGSARAGHPPGAATSALADVERRALAEAITIAQPAVRRAAPNPGVGCVILDRAGVVVGRGTTDVVGGPHAEVAALADAGDRARGGTAVVTLEPCSHHGRTPPCTDALQTAGIARVVVAHPDPNPTAAGGAEVLRAAGIAVVGPLPRGDRWREAVAGQLEGFLSVVRQGHPHVTLKLAQTLDGRLQAPAGARWITGATARRDVHRWRAARDAVLVGSGTVVADDPGLDVRGVAGAVQPRAVILDGRGRIPPDARVLRPGSLVVTSGADDEVVDRWTDAGAQVLRVPSASARGGVDLSAALAALAGSGVTSVLAEPGATLAAALLEADLVDRLVVHVAPHLGAPPLQLAVATASAAALPPRQPGPGWGTERMGGAGVDLVFQLLRTRGQPT